MDTHNKRQEDGTINTAIYRNPTHTNQYLDFESNHHMSHKLSVVPKTLLKRADTLITQEEDIRKEEETVKEALKICGYPDWSIKRKKDRNNEPKKNEGEEVENKTRIFLPYIKNLSEK
jgi:hypothetical protein